MNYFGMFAKYWEPGRVKTRLAADIGDEAAARLYESFVRSLVHRFAVVGQRRVLCYTPQDRRAEFDALAGTAWEAVPQVPGDLGQRMAAYFDQAFGAGADLAVLIGSDSPTMRPTYITLAAMGLRDHDVVLGPTDDGGYCLVAARGKTPLIFDAIDWSTPNVLQQTINRLKDAQLTYQLLRPWYDVDERADLVRLRDELAAAVSPERWQRDLLAVIQEVL